MHHSNFQRIWTASHAADLAPSRHPDPASTPSRIFDIEIFGDYLTGLAREYVYAVPGSGSKVSQLNWQMDHAAVLGTRLTYRLQEWLSLRGGGWVVIDSDNAMDDYDWFAGY